MAFKIVFQDSEFKSSTSEIHKTTVDKNDLIEINFYSNKDLEHSFWMDKPTAIRFAKTLRTEINKIQS